MENEVQTAANTAQKSKFCKHCGAAIPMSAVICTHCGCQVEELKQAQSAVQPSIVISNTNTSTNANVNPNMMYGKTPRNKWVAFFLCLFLGLVGAHKFYEGKAGMGVLYIFTVGLFGIGWFADCIVLLCKPNPYWV